ncbi:MAG: endonuclease domain-containing protein [bacterium]
MTDLRQGPPLWLTECARDLRRHQTTAEQYAWSQLRKRQFGALRFRRQQPIGPFLVDFFCARYRLVIEIDGSVHLAAEQAMKDAARDELMRADGLTILRFRNDDVLREWNLVEQEILVTIAVLEGKRQR